MLATQDKQFRLNDSGQVLFQPDATNPLPGAPVGTLRKGAALLAPEVALNDGDPPPALIDREKAQARLNEWLAAHMTAVLGPLTALATADAPDVETPVAKISRRVHEALGILPRADIEGFIDTLDAEGRRDLRTRKIRLGPVLVWMPDLTKPAAVRLRALLWALWNDQTLPVSVPPDGMVSTVVDPAAIDPLFYRGIGYPVYGRRAIRIDMLDRVISAIYDGADKGVFKARHEMAEWLGCPIAELYEVLTAMGHTKISDPADAPAAPMVESAPEAAVDVPAAAEAPAAEAVLEKAPEKADDAAPTEVPVPVPQVKPDLATFRLRRGRAHQEANRGPRRDASGHGGDKKHDGRKKEFSKPDRKKGDFNKGDDHKKNRSAKPYDRKKNDRDRFDDRENRVVATAEAKKADSPFAVLNQLKAGRKE